MSFLGSGALENTFREYPQTILDFLVGKNVVYVLQCKQIPVWSYHGHFSNVYCDS